MEQKNSEIRYEKNVEAGGVSVIFGGNEAGVYYPPRLTFWQRVIERLRYAAYGGYHPSRDSGTHLIVRSGRRG